MNLKSRLFLQNMLVLAGTLLATLCLSTIFGYLYAQVKGVPTQNTPSSTKVVVLKDDETIYSSGEFSNVQIREMLMNLGMNRPTYKLLNKTYELNLEAFKTQEGGRYQLLKITPRADYAAYYSMMFWFILFCFIIVFMVASLIAQYLNTRNIAEPIVRLTSETGKLADGELETEIVEEGYGEIQRLCGAVEQLRLKLRESVYYKEKYDENRTFLISSISHDLKTPVTSIKGYIDGILDGVAKSPEKQQSYLKKASDKTTLITTMIDDLLLYSKLDLNQIPFHFEKLDIMEYIRYSVDDNRFIFEREGKTIRIAEEISPASVLLDGSRFRRVVQNILDNARKHTAEVKGRVEIYLREVKHNVIIEFRDNGEGIAKEDLPHIFDRFYRGDASRKAEGSSGLGLAIAKLIVEGMGGRIWAISDKDRGTSIILSLKKVQTGGTYEKPDFDN